MRSQNIRLLSLGKTMMWTLYTNNPWPPGPFDLTERVCTGTGKLKMTSVLQGSPCKSPFLHANFLSVSFYLSSSSFNCSFFLHVHGEIWWAFLLLFLCGWKKEGKNLLFSTSCINRLLWASVAARCSTTERIRRKLGEIQTSLAI